MKIPALALWLLIGFFSGKAQIQRTITPADKGTQLEKVKPPEQKSRFREILRQLDLTRKQQIQLKQLRNDHQAKRASIESNDQLNEEEKKRQLRELQKELLARIQSLLTDEQREKLKTLTRENKITPGDKDG